MASKTLSPQKGWAVGETITVYERDLIGQQTGSAITTAAVGSNSTVAFTGLSDDKRYIATDGTTAVQFSTFTASETAQTGSGVEPWAAATDYEVGQVVTHGPMTLKAAADHTSGSTLDPDNWEMLSSGVAEAEHYGHSFLASPADRYNFVSRLNVMLGLTKSYDAGVGGSKVQARTGWEQVLSSTWSSGGVPAHPAFAAEAGFGPRTQLATVTFGVNEPASGDERTAFIQSMRAFIAVLLCSGRYRGTHPSIDGGAGGFASTFGANAGFYTGDNGVRGNGAQGDVITFTAPDTHPEGRAVWPLFLASTSVTNAVITLTKNAGAAGTITAAPGTAASSERGLIAGRVADVDPADDVAATLTTLAAGNVYSAEWAVESDPLPLVLVATVAPWSGPPANDPTSINAALAALVAEFNVFTPNVVLVDITTPFEDDYPAGLSGDVLHPNADGGGRIGKAYFDAAVANAHLIPPSSALARGF